MNYNKIKDIAAQKKIPISSLCQMVGITEGGFYQAIKNDSFKVRTIEEIATVLEVNPAVFFDESGDNVNVNQGAGVNTGKMTQNVSVGNLKDCQKELEKAQLEIEYLKRENSLLRDMAKKN